MSFLGRHGGQLGACLRISACSSSASCAVCIFLSARLSRSSTSRSRCATCRSRSSSAARRLSYSSAYIGSASPCPFAVVVVATGFGGRAGAVATGFGGRAGGNSCFGGRGGTYPSLGATSSGISANGLSSYTCIDIAPRLCSCSSLLPVVLVLFFQLLALRLSLIFLFFFGFLSVAVCCFSAVLLSLLLCLSKKSAAS